MESNNKEKELSPEEVNKICIGCLERRVMLRDGAFLLAILYTLGYFFVVFALLFHEIPSSNEQIINQNMPILSAIQLGIVQYFYNKTREDARFREMSTLTKDSKDGN
jgi:hypothetical protein